MAAFANLALALAFVAVAFANGADEPTHFALRFTTFSVDGVNHATARSQTLVTNLDGSPMFLEMETESGPEAKWTSVLVNQSGNSWAERGNITFGAGGKDVLCFESPGLTGVQLGANYGGIVYNITGGTGKFEGATGVMVDTFLAPSSNASAPFYISAWGTVWLHKK